jgi:hypothetical protein
MSVMRCPGEWRSRAASPVFRFSFWRLAGTIIRATRTRSSSRTSAWRLRPRREGEVMPETLAPAGPPRKAVPKAAAAALASPARPLPTVRATHRSVLNRSQPNAHRPNARPGRQTPVRAPRAGIAWSTPARRPCAHGCNVQPRPGVRCVAPRGRSGAAREDALKATGRRPYHDRPAEGRTRTTDSGFQRARRSMHRETKGNQQRDGHEHHRPCATHVVSRSHHS